MTFIEDGDIDRALLVALVLEEEELRMRLITARAVRKTSEASLAWSLAEFARACLIDAVVGCWANLHAGVAQEVHASVAYETLLAGVFTLKAVSVALGTNVVQREVV